MSRHPFLVRYSRSLTFLVSLLAAHAPALAYSVEEASDWLNAAAGALASPSPGSCADADRFLSEADAHIDQVLRERTLNRNCTTQPLGDLRQLALSLAQLNRSILTQCGMRRNYDNTLGNIDGWLSTPVCGPPDHAQRCQEYARAAVRANQRNNEKRCGYLGEHWHSDEAIHYNWCLGKTEWDAHQESQGRKILLDNCDAPGKPCNDFAGDWNWFNGGRIRIKPDNSFDAAGNGGTWRCLSSNQIEMRWNEGGWVDILSISPDGNNLSGSNQHGGPVSASRGQVTSAKAMLYDVEQGPYGGGRLCLTADEAARIRNDPNTRRFAEVGQPCSK